MPRWNLLAAHSTSRCKRSVLARAAVFIDPSLEEMRRGTIYIQPAYEIITRL
ncbi:hypothetical protein KCP74_14820 [Salmonella enterica subsp. enterica]|nr:hypothetical protein KCP74_14820 [Salmonella enterica subsp. enterica]